MKKYKWSIICTLLSIPIIIVVGVFIYSGTNIFAAVFFPYTTLSLALFERIIVPLRILAFIQFPIYGLIVDKLGLKRGVKTVWKTIFIIHASFALIALFLT